ncbi:MAG: hypothetical protein GF350_10750 [Chitinivibrionales bacterium]|nr:hypothetical protein [Chitinivibrionales bacterium]
MKKIVLSILFTTLAACINFPTRFERIENNELRPITAVFSPYPEAAPGDTISVNVHFAGNPVVAIDSLLVSFSVLDNVYGINDTFTTIEPVTVLDSSMALPESISISFTIPDDALDDLIEPFLATADSAIESIDPAFAALISPDIIIDQLNNPDTAFWSSIPDSIADGVLAPALEYTAKRGYFFVTARSQNGTVLKSRAEFVIRFNSNFENIPTVSRAIQVNNNPQINWIGVYKVAGDDVFSFDPLDPNFRGTYEFFCFFNRIDSTCPIDSVITIDTGYSYFFAADSGILVLPGGSRDTTRDSYVQQVRGSDTVVLEEYFYQWFYENMDESALPLDSLFVLERFGQNSITRMYPPLDARMNHFRVWLAVYDEYFGEFFRPRGMAHARIEGVLEFTQAYKDNTALQ